jgi:hypothetical protein
LRRSAKSTASPQTSNFMVMKNLAFTGRLSFLEVRDCLAMSLSKDFAVMTHPPNQRRYRLKTLHPGTRSHLLFAPVLIS